MVLEDLDSPSVDSAYDSSAQNDFRPFDLHTVETIDLSQYPRPLLSTEATTRSLIHAFLKWQQGWAGRPLTEPEARRFIYYHSHFLRDQDHGGVGGMALGGIQFWRTMGTAKFPFGPKLKPDGPVLWTWSGPQALVARHSLRFVMFVALGRFFGQTSAFLFRGPGYQKAMEQDQELADFNAAKRLRINQDREALQKRMRQRVEERNERVREMQEGYNLPQQGNGQTPTSTAPFTYYGYSSSDDMSPTTGDESWSKSSTAGDASPTTSRPGKTTEPRSRIPDPIDDASPTGGMFNEEVRSQTPSQQSSGSAWERLRRGEKPIPTQPTPTRESPQKQQREQTEGSTLGDDWTFPDSDEDRKKDREQAQKEFDARVERERQGGDFNEKPKRW